MCWKLLSTMTVVSGRAMLMVSALTWSANAQSPSGKAVGDSNPRAILRQRSSIDALAKSKALAVAGDSSDALEVLRSATESDKENGLLWYAYAHLLGEMSRYGWRTGIMPGKSAQRVLHATEAYAVAMTFSPDSVRYGVEYATFLWGSRPENTFRATNVADATLDRLEGSTDATSVAVLSHQIGIMLWRGYEPRIGNVVTPRDDDRAQFRDVNGRVSANMYDYARRHPLDPYATYASNFYNTTKRYF
ncbi:MAG: hypothetical protein M3Y64_11700, partial [Gemmatimonadota bacterium]|nr:hypothetical protein [Gemmatimonadota bacterium]